MSTVVKTTKALTQAPLPDIIEKLGMAIAGAQFALDANSAELAKIMAETMVDVGGQEYNLLSLGFTPPSTPSPRPPSKPSCRTR